MSLQQEYLSDIATANMVPTQAVPAHEQNLGFSAEDFVVQSLLKRFDYDPKPHIIVTGENNDWQPVGISYLGGLALIDTYSLLGRAEEPLSPRELQVTSYAMLGAKNGEIGDALYISEDTVKTHLRHAFPKLGVDSRTSLLPTLLTDTPPSMFIGQYIGGRNLRQFSEREIEIIEKVGIGCNNSETGKKLFITADTVKTHLKRISRKTDYSSRELHGFMSLLSRAAPGEPSAEMAAARTSFFETMSFEAFLRNPKGLRQLPVLSGARK